MLSILNYFNTSEEQYMAFPLYPICYHMTVLDAEESPISAVNITQSFCIYMSDIFTSSLYILFYFGITD